VRIILFSTRSFWVGGWGTFFSFIFCRQEGNWDFGLRFLTDTFASEGAFAKREAGGGARKGGREARPLFDDGRTSATLLLPLVHFCGKP